MLCITKLMLTNKTRTLKMFWSKKLLRSSRRRPSSFAELSTSDMSEETIKRMVLYQCNFRDFLVSKLQISFRPDLIASFITLIWFPLELSISVGDPCYAHTQVVFF